MTTMSVRMCAAIFIAVFLSGVAAAQGSDPLAVYEDWRSGSIRPDRWVMREAVAQDMRAEVRGHTLRMRYRQQGTTVSDQGFIGANHLLTFANPAGIDRLEADLKVVRAEVEGCAANPGFTRVRPAAIAFNSFNDGTSNIGLIGDHIVRVLVNREADSPDPPDVLTVEAFVFRCFDAACNDGRSTLFNRAVARVGVGNRFTLRLAWDRPLARFVVGVDDGPDAVLAYDPALDTGNAHVPFADVRMQTVVANCTAAPTSADAEIEVHAIRSNASVVID